MRRHFYAVSKNEREGKDALILAMMSKVREEVTGRARVRSKFARMKIVNLMFGLYNRFL